MVSGIVRDLDGAALALHRAAESATAAAAVLAAMDRGRPNDAGDPGVAAVNIDASLRDLDRAIGSLRSTQRLLERESHRRTEASRLQR